MGRYFNRKSLIVALVFGSASLITVWSGIHFNLPGTNAATDPREIFNSIGAALSGPIGAVIIAVLSTLKGSSAEFQFYITFQHIMSAVWIGWAYKNLAYKKYRMPMLAVMWLLIMLVYYYPTYFPGYLALYIFRPDMWQKFAGSDLSFWPATIRLYSGWMPEIIFSTLFTTVFLIALPQYYRKPLWSECIEEYGNESKWLNQKRFYFKLFAKNFLSLRLAIWFILLFSIAIFYISIMTRNYFSEYILNEELIKQKRIAVQLSTQIDKLKKENIAEFLIENNKYADMDIILTDKHLVALYGNKLLFSDENQKEQIHNEKRGALIDNNKKLSIGFAYADKAELFVLVFSDIKRFDSNLDTIVNFIFVNFGFTLLIISFLGAGIIFFMVGKPVRKLTTVAEEIGKENYEIDVDPSWMTDEVKELAAAVDQMRINILQARNGLIENKQRLNTLSEATFEGIAITENGIIIDANEQITYMCGYNPGELIGMPVTEFVADESIEIVKKAIESNMETPYEHLAKRKDGSVFPVEVRARKLNTNGRIYRVSAIRDITEIKKNQSDLIAAKEIAEKSNKLKSEFLAQMSHEIRSPLNIMLSFLSLIKEETVLSDSPDINDSFQSIETAGKRIIRTVDLILNMSEIQVGSYEPSFDHFDINENVIKSMVKEFELALKNKGLKLIVSIKTDDTNLYADHYSVSQILINLFDNAVKYTNSGSISIDVSRNENGNLQVKMEDTGIGISEEFIQNLFDPFSQEEQGYTRSYEGSGLGLALVKKYCEINNADITVSSIKGKGTIFTITFPLN